MKTLKLSNDRLQLMIDRHLEQRYTTCIFQRKTGEIKMRDPKIGEVKITISEKGECEVSAILPETETHAWKILASGLWALLLSCIGFVFIHPVVVLLLCGGIVLFWALRKMKRKMREEQKVMIFAREVALFLESKLN